MSNFQEPKWGLHSALISKLYILEREAAAVGIQFVVTSGVRGYEHQATLYTAYLANPKEAYRKYGVVAKPAPMGMTRHHPLLDGKAIAVDLDVLEDDDIAKKLKQDRLGALARTIGLVWGADWGDKVHFELGDQTGARFDLSKHYISLGATLDNAS